MNAARQILRQFDRAMGTRTRSAADYSITATISVVPDPLETETGPLSPTFWQLIKYGVVGVLATVVQLVVFYTFATHIFQCLTADDWAVKMFGMASADVSETVRGINFAVCSLVGFVVSNLVCWMLNRAIVFKPGKFSWYVELSMFYAASASAAFLAIGLSWLCINCLGLMTTLAVFIEVVVSFAINYFVRKFFIFKG